MMGLVLPLGGHAQAEDEETGLTREARRVLRRALRDPDPRRREQAIRELVARRAADDLVWNLSTCNSHALRATRYALLALGDGAHGALLRGLRSASDRIRQRALSVLLESPRLARGARFAVIELAMEHPDPFVRKGCAVLAARNGGSVSHELLVELIRTDPSRQVVTCATRLLRQTASKRAREHAA